MRRSCRGAPPAGAADTTGRVASVGVAWGTDTANEVNVDAPDASAASFGYHPALDGIRALAVLAVIAYHDNYTWARGGFLGVDTFFVLSGFLITTLLVLEFRRNSTIAFGAFWARRGRRLLPALLLVLCFVALYTHRVAAPWQRTSIRGDMLSSLLYVANWRFIFDQQGYFQIFSAASPLRHMWSLAIEEQYYLVWPLIVFGCLRFARGSLRTLGLVCAGGAVASIVVMRLLFSPSDPSRAYYGTDARAHTILIGALLAVVFVASPPGPRTRRFLALASVPAVAALFVAFSRTSGTSTAYYRGGSALFAVIVAFVVAGALQPGPLSRVLSVTPLVWIGRISYGLYLWHWVINVWLVPSRVHVSPNALNVLRLAVTFAAATASYFLVERPIRQRTLRPHLTAAAFAPAVAAVAGIVVISASGAAAQPQLPVAIKPTAVPAPRVVSARGVAPPPKFIWGYGDPLICGPPRPSESREAAAAERRFGRLALPASARHERILLVGDSTACSLWPGLRAVGDAQSIVTDQGSVFGCGVASDEITTTRNEAITPHSNRCHAMVDWTQANALARVQPTVVVWMSIWEKSDLVVGGRTIVAGTRAWETEIMARLDAALARLTAGGARVVLVTEAAPAPNPAQGTELTDPKADDAGYVRLNALLRRFQARHRATVTLVDLAAKVCPDGPPCPERVHGMHARPDGRHFTPTAATWAARGLVAQIFGTAR
jgi:peptidoglycan/LPS O-acetylase OafA/YrhL